MKAGRFLIAVSAGVLCLTAAGGSLRGADGGPSVDGKPLTKLLEQLRSDNRGLQMRAARSLAKAPADLQTAIVPELIPLLKSERENDKFVAAQALGEYGPAARAAVPSLLPLLEGTQFERNRAAAARALGLILKDAEPGEEAERAAQALIAVFRDRYSDVRREAVYACGMIGPAAASCIPRLPELFNDGENPWNERGGYYRGHEWALVREAAAWACGRMGQLAVCHIDRLIAMMHSHTSPAVVEAIGRIGPVNENVVKNILDRMEKVMNTEHIMLGELRAGEYLPTCFAVLERFGPRAKAAIPLMVRLLSEQPWQFGGPHIPRMAASVLGAIGPAAGEAVPEIERLIRNTRDPEVRKAAEQALERISFKEERR